MKTWREKAAPIIDSVIEANLGKPVNAIRKALREAFPWGPMQYHPYKIWLNECRVQLEARGLLPRKEKPVEESTEPTLF